MSLKYRPPDLDNMLKNLTSEDLDFEKNLISKIKRKKKIQKITIPAISVMLITLVFLFNYNAQPVSSGIRADLVDSYMTSILSEPVSADIDEYYTLNTTSNYTIFKEENLTDISSFYKDLY
ncbi:MAG TPA: hypothetical protein VKS21_11240 [Spirochaetota bacterium]|nr:hypothetical protein [Spirochaetota bacterium]